MTVWAVHTIKDLDISSANAYGDIRFINNRYIYADELVDDDIPDEFGDRIEKAAEDYDPKSDYVLIAGDHLQLVALVAAVASRCPRLRVLRYDREAKGYLAVNIYT